MTIEPNSNHLQSESPEAAVRRLVRTALKASLATLDPGGHPYASLVTIATEPDGTPLMLLSRLALHTQNLDRDPRASLLFDGTGAAGDPLAGGRVTLIGEARRTASATAKRRFIARQPASQGYAGFADFGFFAFVPERAHYIGGFGRIVDVPRSELTSPVEGAEALVAAEEEIVAHMNADHSDAVALYAARLLGAAPGDWRMSGIDPLGADLVADGEGRRLLFAGRVTTPAEARRELVRLAEAARSQ